MEKILNPWEGVDTEGLLKFLQGQIGFGHNLQQNKQYEACFHANGGIIAVVVEGGDTRTMQYNDRAGCEEIIGKLTALGLRDESNVFVPITL